MGEMTAVVLSGESFDCKSPEEMFDILVRHGRHFRDDYETDYYEWNYMLAATTWRWRYLKAHGEIVFHEWINI